MSEAEPHNIPGLVRSSTRPRVPLPAAPRPSPATAPAAPAGLRAFAGFPFDASQPPIAPFAFLVPNRTPAFHDEFRYKMDDDVVFSIYFGKNSINSFGSSQIYLTISK